ncbi:MAG: hypothetical protein QM817_32685 [Archangium sp.]
MRALSLTSLALALCACPDPQQGEGCLDPIPDQRTLRAPLADRAVQGLPVTRTIEAPLTNCGATPKAQVDLAAPGNRVAMPDQISGVSVTGQVVSVSVTFTPDAPGTWRVSALFPGLGSRTVDVEVIRSRTDEPVPLALPAAVNCPKGPWVFESHAACEQPDASIAWFPLDGGAVNVVPGRELAVVQNVWWLLNVAGDTLERYEWDAGLTRTHQWSNVTSTALRGVHTTTSAVRATTGFSVRVVDTDGYDQVVDCCGASSFDTGILFAERDADDAGGLRVLAASFQDEWVGVEPHVVWTHVSEQLSPHARPFQQVMPTASVFFVAPNFLKPPRQPLARWPAWSQADGFDVVATERRNGIEVFAWQGHHTLLRASDDVFLFWLPDGGFATAKY